MTSIYAISPALEAALLGAAFGALFVSVTAIVVLVTWPASARRPHR